jgi:hypothetical protein
MPAATAARTRSSRASSASSFAAISGTTAFTLSVIAGGTAGIRNAAGSTRTITVERSSTSGATADAGSPALANEAMANERQHATTAAACRHGAWGARFMGGVAQGYGAGLGGAR